MPDTNTKKPEVTYVGKAFTKKPEVTYVEKTFGPESEALNKLKNCKICVDWWDSSCQFGTLTYVDRYSIGLRTENNLDLVIFKHAIRCISKK